MVNPEILLRIIAQVLLNSLIDWNRRPPFNPHASSAGATNGGAGPGGGGPRPQSPPVDPNPNLYIHNVPKVRYMYYNHL